MDTREYMERVQAYRKQALQAVSLANTLKKKIVQLEAANQRLVEENRKLRGLPEDTASKDSSKEKTQEKNEVEDGTT